MEPLSQYHNTYTTQKHKTNTTTTTSIITNYFDFELGDLELNQYKRDLNLSKESCAEIASIMKSFQHYLKTNLSSFTYPYFQTAFIPFYSKLNDTIHRIYLLLLFISKKDEIEKTLSSFFRVLIKANHFGIGKQYNSLFTEKVIHSIEYSRFIDKMAKWHTQSEMIIFYIWVLKEYFDVSLSYSKESYSLEKNFRLTFETFAQKNVLKFSSFICSKLSVPLGFSLIDYKTIFFLIMTSFTCGTYSLFTAKQIQKLLSVSAVNCVIQKLSELMEYEGQLTDFRKLSGKDIRLISI